MASFSLPGSRDELLAHEAYHSDDIIIEQNSIPSSGTETPEISRGRKRVDWSIPEDQEEELRSELHRVLTDANGPSPDRSLQNLHPPAPPKSVLRKGDITPNLELDENFDDGIENLNGKNLSAHQAQERASQIAQDLSRPSTPLQRSTRSSPTRKPKNKRRQLSASSHRMFFHTSEELDSGMVTPEENYEDYVPKPAEWRTSGLSALNLAKHWRERRMASSADDGLVSGTATPLGGSPLSRSPRGSTTSLVNLIATSTALGALGGQEAKTAENLRRSNHLRAGSEDQLPFAEASRDTRPSLPRSHSSTVIDTLSKLGSSWRTPKDDEAKIRIEKHLQDVKLRQKYLAKLCRALMEYGAPTHRLEEYMRMSARVLEIEAQFLYIPGCMIVSFDDSKTHTTEMKLIRTNQGVDLGKLRDTHDMYKDVVHDHIGVEEASDRLDDIIARRDKYNRWLRVLFYGIASASVGPWAFQAGLIDLPLAFALGCILGYMQIFWAVKSELYQNVFELLAVVITSFLARALGSIRGGNMFCFSALAQSAITLILPGYTVLCGALELQSRSIIAGSVRLVWAIIYALFLGFALTIGTAFYGLVDHGATNATTCRSSMAYPWYFLFVPVFTISLTIINKAKYAQMPVMIIIAFGGYMVSYWSAEGFAGNPQISSTFGALAISIMANLYSRLGVKIDDAANEGIRRIKNTLKLHVRNTGSETPIGYRTPSMLEKQDDRRHENSGLHSFANRLRRILLCQSQRKPPIVLATISQGGDPGHESPGSESLDHEELRRKRVYPLAAAAMLPAIFVQVPSGLSVAGSLVQGLETANQITGHKSGSSVVTAQDVTSQRAIGSSISFTVGYSIVQVAIGITVGLFLGTLLVYPLGKGGKRSKMRSGLFSF